MARSDEDPLDTAIPEADRLEQQQHADPTSAPDEEWPVLAGEVVDEADRFEQVQEVLADPDEDYAPDPP